MDTGADQDVAALQSEPDVSEVKTLSGEAAGVQKLFLIEHAIKKRDFMSKVFTEFR